MKTKVKTIRNAKHIQSIIDTAIDWLNDNAAHYTGDTSDLHNEIFNTDYFIIGTYKAKEFLSNGPGIFEAIEMIKTYENENFGQCTTDLSDPERVVNMYAYIVGEAVLNECQTLRDHWNENSTPEILQAIKQELEFLEYKESE